MARKDVLYPQYINATTVSATNQPLTQSLAASFNTISTNLQFQDSCCYQVNITTSDSIGSFVLQCSQDNQNWASVGTAGIVSAANDTAVVEYDISRTAPHVRLAYTAGTAGTGTCTILVSAKQVGG